LHCHILPQSCSLFSEVRSRQTRLPHAAGWRSLAGIEILSITDFLFFPCSGTSLAALDPTDTYLRTPLDNQYIISLILQQKRHLALAGISLIACVGANLASPVLSGLLFETLVLQRPFEAYGRILAVLLGLYVCEPLLSQVYIQQVCAIGEKVQLSLRLEAFRVLLMQGMEFFDRHRASELTNLLSKDLEVVRQFVFSNVSRDRGLRAFCEASGAVVVLFWLSWRLGPVLAGVIVATTCIAWLYRVQSKALENISGKAQGEMAGCVDQAMTNVRTVRIYAGEALERERFGRYATDAFAAGQGFARAKAQLECLNRGAVHFSLLALYGLGGWLVNTGQLPVSTLLTAIGYTFSLVFATQGLLQTWADIRQMLASVQRVQRTLSELPTDPSMAEALPPGAWWNLVNENQGLCSLPSSDEEGLVDFTGGLTAVEAARACDLVFSKVNFSYPVRREVRVISDLSLRLRRGQVTAIVGRSGAGKSTVAALIERLYSVETGTISLGDVPIDAFSRSQWVEAVAAVTQEPVLFAGTVFDNIAYGKPRATMEEVQRAALASHAHDFITALPQGYDTVVGDRGSLLSGGQRQRLALARALLKDAPIVILDEPTSSLDAESEQLIQRAIDRLMQGRTVVVIAHRLSTVQAADQILVMDEGKIVECGTHHELIRRGGRYRGFVSSQALTLNASQ
jgi:ATP-binding cassette, subfamily B (MDR/TAP), member 10